MAARRFPPPWSIEDIEAAFIVRDTDGQKLTHVGGSISAPTYPSMIEPPGP